MAPQPPTPPVPGPPERTTPYAWYVAAMLSMAYLLSIMDRFLLGVVIDEIKASLQLSDTQLGVLQGPSFALLFLVASVPLGRLADIADRRLIVTAGLTWWSLATAACGLADSFGALVAARLAVGLGEAALLPAAMSMILAYFSRDKLNRGISIYSMGGSFGRAAAFTGGGALFAWLAARGGLRLGGAANLQPWQGVFVAAGAAGLAVALLFLLSVREPSRLAAGRERGTAAEGFAHFWRNRRAYFAVFMPFAMSAAIAMQLAAWTVAFYRREHALSVADASALVGITGLLFGPLGHFLGGWITDLLRARGMRGPQPLVLAVSLLVATLCVALFVLLPGVASATAAYCVAYLALCAAGPVGLGGVQLPTPERHRGFIASLFLLFYTALGSGLGPLLVGLIADYGVGGSASLGRSMFAATALFAILGLPFALLLYRSFDRAAAAHESAGHR